jgi:hypothetical protein
MPRYGHTTLFMESEKISSALVEGRSTKPSYPISAEVVIYIM